MRRQSATVAAMDHPVCLQDVEVLADGDLRGVKVFGQASDQHATVVFNHLYDQAAAFFVKHRLFPSLVG
jgi:hypothetical protein